MKVFGDGYVGVDGDYIKLQTDPGQDPQYIGDLHWVYPGMQRFDIVDDRKEGQPTQDQYFNVSLSTPVDGAHADEISVMFR
jgi:hypothetical protein